METPTSVASSQNPRGALPPRICTANSPLDGHWVHGQFDPVQLVGFCWTPKRVFVYSIIFQLDYPILILC